MNQEKVKRILLGQIREYLDGEITKEEYEAMAEPFYSQYCHYSKLFCLRIDQSGKFYLKSKIRSAFQRDHNLQAHTVIHIAHNINGIGFAALQCCLLYTSPSPRD